MMESATFRKWLADRGCRFDHHEHQRRGKGQMMVTVHREGRKTEVPLGGSRQNLDQRAVHRACEELGLDPSNYRGRRAACEAHYRGNDYALPIAHRFQDAIVRGSTLSDPSGAEPK
jgi:hypothetical protein